MAGGNRTSSWMPSAFLLIVFFSSVQIFSTVESCKCCCCSTSTSTCDFGRPTPCYSRPCQCEYECDNTGCNPPEIVECGEPCPPPRLENLQFATLVPACCCDSCSTEISPCCCDRTPSCCSSVSIATCPCDCGGCTYPFTVETPTCRCQPQPCLDVSYCVHVPQPQVQTRLCDLQAHVDRIAVARNCPCTCPKLSDCPAPCQCCAPRCCCANKACCCGRRCRRSIGDERSKNNADKTAPNSINDRGKTVGRSSSDKSDKRFRGAGNEPETPGKTDSVSPGIEAVKYVNGPALSLEPGSIKRNELLDILDNLNGFKRKGTIRIVEQPPKKVELRINQYESELSKRKHDRKAPKKVPARSKLDLFKNIIVKPLRPAKKLESIGDVTPAAEPKGKQGVPGDSAPGNKRHDKDPDVQLEMEETDDDDSRYRTTKEHTVQRKSDSKKVEKEREEPQKTSKNKFDKTKSNSHLWEAENEIEMENLLHDDFYDEVNDYRGSGKDQEERRQANQRRPRRIEPRLEKPKGKPLAASKLSSVKSSKTNKLRERKDDFHERNSLDYEDEDCDCPECSARRFYKRPFDPYYYCPHMYRPPTRMYGDPRRHYYPPPYPYPDGPYF